MYSVVFFVFFLRTFGDNLNVWERLNQSRDDIGYTYVSLLMETKCNREFARQWSISEGETGMWNNTRQRF